MSIKKVFSGLFHNTIDKVREMRINKAGILLLSGAIISGTGAVYFTDKYISLQIETEKNKIRKMYKTGRVVVAKKNLLRGDILSYENMAIRDMPVSFLHSNVIKESESMPIIGRRILQPLKSGEPLLSNFLVEKDRGSFSSLIENGNRALTFPVDINSSMSGLLRPGDRIDLMLTLNLNSKNETIPLLRNVPILATGSIVDNKGKIRLNGDFQTITVSVKPIDAAKITHARETGSVTVLLRSSNNSKTGIDYELKQPVTINTLTGRIKKKYNRHHAIDVIIGG